MALDPTERLELVSDKLLTKALTRDLDRLQILTQIQPEVFTNENFLIYKTLHSFRDRNLVPDKEFLKMYLTRNPKMILNNRSNVEPSLFMDTAEGEDIITAFISATVSKLSRLLDDDVTDDNTELLIEKFKLDYKTIQTQRILDTTKLILNDQYEHNRKIYSGWEDSRAYFEEQMIKLDSLVGDKDGVISEIDNEIGMIDDSRDKPVKVSDFGKLEFLNEHYGGILTGFFYGLVAPTKGGKSKFMWRILHTAKVVYGTHCAYWGVEGGTQRALAEMRAIHFDWYYNQQQGNNYTGLSGDDILHDRFPSQEYRELEAVSRSDYYNNPNYGRVSMLGGDLLLETFEGVLKNEVSRRGVKLVIIDYLQMMTSKNTRLPKNEVISKAYQKSLAFAGKHQVAFLSPAQMKQSFMDDLYKDSGGDVRTAGGESSEIIRSPDVNLALYATMEDLENNKMTLLSMPSRVASAFPPRDIFVDLSINYYSDITWD